MRLQSYKASSPKSEEHTHVTTNLSNTQPPSMYSSSAPSTQTSLSLLTSDKQEWLRLLQGRRNIMDQQIYVYILPRLQPRQEI